MAYFQPMTIKFDDGREATVQTSSRDLLFLEKAKIDTHELGSVEASYVIAHATLQRYKRTGRVAFDVPETAEDLMASADLVYEQDFDPEGKGSGQEANTG